MIWTTVQKGKAVAASVYVVSGVWPGVISCAEETESAIVNRGDTIANRGDIIDSVLKKPGRLHICKHIRLDPGVFGAKGRMTLMGMLQETTTELGTLQRKWNCREISIKRKD